VHIIQDHFLIISIIFYKFVISAQEMLHIFANISSYLVISKQGSFSKRYLIGSELSEIHFCMHVHGRTGRVELDFYWHDICTKLHEHSSLGLTFVRRQTQQLHSVSSFPVK
jgi:hypothetical protein